MKQTAVDWYFDKIKSHFEHDGDLFEVACMTYAIAKEKEKNQTTVAYGDGQQNGREYEQKLSKGHDCNIVTAEQYYNETYETKTIK
jgi:hypothetical protein